MESENWIIINISINTFLLIVVGDFFLLIGPRQITSCLNKGKRIQVSEKKIKASYYKLSEH